MFNGTLYVNGVATPTIPNMEIRMKAALDQGDALDNLLPAHDIFISHKSDDRITAECLAQFISAQDGPKCYVDTLDPEVSGDSPQLAKYLLNVIHRCKALLAVVSAETQQSWWVPYEIGAADAHGRGIATYLKVATETPSYLKVWPVLSQPFQARHWAKRTCLPLFPSGMVFEATLPGRQDPGTVHFQGHWSHEIWQQAYREEVSLAAVQERFLNEIK